MSENLMEGLINELNRVRELLKDYEEIGPAGIFGATMLKQDIKKAEKAISSGDVIQMLLAYNSLKECQ